MLLLPILKKRLRGVPAGSETACHALEVFGNRFVSPEFAALQRKVSLPVLRAEEDELAAVAALSHVVGDPRNGEAW